MHLFKVFPMYFQCKKLALITVGISFALVIAPPVVASDDVPPKVVSAADQRELESALAKAGNNRQNLELALSKCAAAERESLEFLIRNMPTRDLTTLSHELLLENVQLAHEVASRVPWGQQIPQEIFWNDVLPYANTTEKREPWRRKLYTQFFPKVAQAKSPSEAAAILNNSIFGELNVRYSTQRRRADQSPQESIDSGLASCSGLSILLINACRAVGVPARFVGTPLWADGSGNHSWVEVWDDGWHFTGAAEPNGMNLNAAWFTGRASQAIGDDPMKAIYAVSYRKTPIHFPLVWAPNNHEISAINVTDRYTRVKQVTPAEHTLLRIRATNLRDRQRVTVDFAINDSQGKSLATGKTKDERFDSNDHAEVIVPNVFPVQLTAKLGEQTAPILVIEQATEGQLIDIQFDQ
jgi:hypothetical protein